MQNFGKLIEIGGQKIGANQPAFLIAEISQNHNADVSLAKKLIDAAKEAGCSAAKFQTFTAEIMCADRSKMFTYQSQGKTITESEFDLLKRYEFSPDQWQQIIEHCRNVDIPFMTTVQDPPNLELMLGLGIDAIKIGSDDFDHLPNLQIYAETELPLVMSKGMASLGEVDRVIQFLRQRTDKVAIMHCVSLYPTAAKDCNLRQIQTLSSLYPDIIWGFSDHSQGPLAATLAVTMGAKIIEKHFTLDHEMAGPDHWFSMDVTEMSQMVKDIRFAEEAFGDGDVTPAEAEIAERAIRRRRVVAKKDLAAGESLNLDTVTFKRADVGLFVSEWDLINGFRVSKPVLQNQGIQFSDIDFSQ